MSGKTLAEKLEELVRGSQINEEQLDILLAGFQRLSGSGIVDTALSTGDLAPDFRLQDQQGGTHSLSEWLEHGPVILQFFRGDWCPYCQTQLKALTAEQAGIYALGARLLCISPETAGKHQEMTRKLGLELTLLSDPGGVVANTYGIAYDLNAAESGLYSELGIELTERPDSRQEFLPIPASYIVLPGGRIGYCFIEPDFRRRSEPAELLTELSRLSAGSQS